MTDERSPCTFCKTSYADCAARGPCCGSCVHQPGRSTTDVLRWAAEGVMEFLDEGLANGSCAFRCNDNEQKEHVEGCWCDVLQKALRGVRD